MLLGYCLGSAFYCYGRDHDSEQLGEKDFISLTLLGHSSLLKEVNWGAQTWQELGGRN